MGLINTDPTSKMKREANVNIRSQRRNCWNENILLYLK
jgi:hypothetical protein